MEGVEADPLIGDARQRRRVNRPAVGVGQTETDIIQQNDEDIRRILRDMALLHPSLVLGILQSSRGHADRRGGRERQHRTVVGRRGGMA